MNKIVNVCLIAFMMICMFLVDLFMSIEKWLFMCISIFGIIIAIGGLVFFNRYLLRCKKR